MPPIVVLVDSFDGVRATDRPSQGSRGAALLQGNLRVLDIFIEKNGAKTHFKLLKNSF